MSFSIIIIIFLFLIIVHNQTTTVFNTNSSSMITTTTASRAELAHRNSLVARYDYPFVDFPYFVNVFSDVDRKSNTYQFLCSASLISFYWSLTAASCKLTIKNASYLIYAGIIPDPVININLYPGEYGRGDWRIISDWILHPMYNPKNIPQHDIALLYFEVPFTMNRYIGFVQLVSSSKACDDVKGRFDSCQIPVFENKKLDVNNRFAFVPVFLTENNICQVEIDGKLIKPASCHICSKMDVQLNNTGCLGSLGSPLTCSDRLVGIMLDVFKCDESYKAIYTRVGAYEFWIQRYINHDFEHTEMKRNFKDCQLKERASPIGGIGTSLDNHTFYLFCVLHILHLCLLYF